MASSKSRKLLVPSDHPALKQVCRPVAPGEYLEPLFDRMRKACKTNDGVGLAAPQVGDTRAVIFTLCADACGTVKGRFMVNPKITHYSQETDISVEGCLSYPGIHKRIKRSRTIEITYEDERRRERRTTAHGFEARVIQHEYDHCSGICRVGDPAYASEPETDTSCNFALLAAALACVAEPSVRI
jgi:peptide deformylase